MQKLHKGAELILQDYVGTSVIDFAVELLDDDCNAMDVSVYENFRFELYAKRGGTLLDSMDLNSGVTINANTITINRSRIYSSFRKGLIYYHHLIGVRSLVDNELTHEEDVLWYGPIEAI